MATKSPGNRNHATLHVESSLRLLRLGVYAFLLLTVSGCDYLPFGNTPVRDVIAKPANFEGKEVKLSGKVTDVTKLPIVELKSFVLDDDTGDIWVTTNLALPAVGDRVTLKGVVKSAVIVGGKSLGLHVEESKRLP